ncbi:hypothetical protein ERJ75_001140100 [Trypanosoma vivax]|nr:hypothetical protein ERJ75_001140100 [Trypanosoma vivax]
MAAALIDNDMDLDAAIAKAAKGGLGGHGNNDATLLGAILQSTNTPTTLKSPDATRTGHTTGDSSNDGKACPWTVYRGKSSGTQAGIIPKSSGAERTVTLGALWTITPHSTHPTQTQTDQTMAAAEKTQPSPSSQPHNKHGRQSEIGQLN